MARKTITELTGIDPEYSRQFAEDAPPPPTKQAVADPSEAPELERLPEPKPKQAAASSTPPQARTRAPAGPLARPRKARGSGAAARGAVRQISISMYPLAAHKDGLDGLAAHGIAAADTIRVAGRRAVAKYVPKAVFEEVPQADRLLGGFCYTTTKAVDAALLDKLREENDPLGLRGKGALLRGQIEPIFWSELDAVIEELSKKYLG